MPRTLLITLALTFAATAAACSSPSYLRYRVNDSVVPVTNGEDPGRAVGQCLRTSSGGPVTTRCPGGVDAFFRRPVTHQMDKPGTYSHGIFARGGLSDPTDEVVVAYEMLTYTSRAVTWRPKIDDRDKPTVRALCDDARLAETPVIVRAFEGCAVNLAGTHKDAWRWTIDDLARQGAFVGQPDGFWAQEPDADTRPSKPKCKTLRVVQAEVQTVGQICATYRADLYPERMPAQTTPPPASPPDAAPGVAVRLTADGQLQLTTEGARR